MNPARRKFLEDVGRGMMVAGLGATLAGELGISYAFADEGPGTLDFGELQPLVGLMQETPPEKLQPMLVKKLARGETDLRRLVAAAALANAETFGGQDYVGYHTEMALLPAYQMAKELPDARQPLPVLKVLYRNAGRIQQSGLAKAKRLRPVAPSDSATGTGGGKLLRDATRSADMEKAERIFAAQASRCSQEAFHHLLWSVQDDSNVHRFVLAHRAWGLIEIVGTEHAHTMLRQCVRFCVDAEQNRKQKNRPEPPVRRLVPKLLDGHKLLARRLGTRQPGDGWLEEMSNLIYERTGEEAMEAMAAALAEGISPQAVNQAISLAANQLVLRQDRLSNGSWRSHGATPGVHASDSANAWRHMVRVADQRGAVVGMLVNAYHTGGHHVYKQEPLPHTSHRDKIEGTDAKSLLGEAEAAIRDNDQGRAAAAVEIYSEKGFAPRAVFDLMLRYGISEDGLLHAEKFYRTVREEFAATSPALRWRHLIALARVTASAYGLDAADKPGHQAPGYEQACKLLGVPA